MNVTPRKNRRDISCVNCGVCIAACDRELGRGRGLFQYCFGSDSASVKEVGSNLKDISPTPR